MAILVISYSRIDQPQVRAVVKLLQSALGTIEKTVFWDDDFEPGNHGSSKSLSRSTVLSSSSSSGVAILLAPNRSNASFYTQ